MTNDLTPNMLIEMASEHFEGLFDWMGFKEDKDTLLFAATKGDHSYSHEFFLHEWNITYKGGMLHHALESLKGRFIVMRRHKEERASSKITSTTPEWLKDNHKPLN